MSPSAYSQNTAPSYPPLVTGIGAEVHDVDGKRYIDCCSQTLNNNLGQCHPVIRDAVERQMNRLTYASSRFSSDVSLQLHQKLIEITPASFIKVNLASVTGSLANECAIKAARKRSGTELIISLERSHLGQSMETMRISGKHEGSEMLGQRNVRLLPAPYCFRCPFQQKPSSCNAQCLDRLDDIDRADGGNVAAIVVEPIMVDAGILAPPIIYHQRLRDFARTKGIALVWDEIQTAFGWLGCMFASEIYGVTPDILTLGKGLGAGFPIAATLFGDEYDVLTYGEHEFTSGAHPISCAASLAMINHLLESDELECARGKAKHAHTRLAELAEKSPIIGDVRGMGLLIGIEIVNSSSNDPDSEKTRFLFKELLANGVITRASRVGLHSNVIQFKPPIVITDDELDEALTKIEHVVLSDRL